MCLKEAKRTQEDRPGVSLLTEQYDMYRHELDQIQPCHA